MISCPYLSKIPSSTIKKQTDRLLATASKCPFMKKFPGWLDQTKRSTSLQTNFSANQVEPNTFCQDYNCSFRYDEKLSKMYRVETQKNRECAKKLLTQSMVKKFDFSNFFKQRIQARKDESTYRVFKKILRNSKEFPYAYDYTDGNKKKVTVWCSNDYLGLTRHPYVMQETIRAIQKHGSGSGGTRNISGNTVLHERLESELADFHKKESALVFTSCFVANEATLHTLGTLIPDLTYFSDAGNHASMIHGIRTSQAEKQIFNHNDPRHLDYLLTHCDPAKPKVVAFETVHSMSGQICPLKDFLDVSERHGAFTFVDEVHAIGLYGNEGAGVAEEQRLMDRVDVITGTLGKAVGNVGGYIAGSREMVDMIRNYAGSFIFTTSLPPSAMAGSLASLKVLRSSEGLQLRDHLRSNVRLLRRYLEQEGIPILQGSSHIIPVLVGDADICTQISNCLLSDHSIYVQAINYPTVKKGESRLRISTTPYHDEALIKTFVDSLVKVWKQFNLPKVNEFISK